MNYKDGWEELKTYLFNSIGHLDNLSLGYNKQNNISEWRRIDKKRIEYKNLYRKMEEIEESILK